MKINSNLLKLSENVLEIYNVYQLHIKYRTAITYHAAVHFNILFVKQLNVLASVWREVNIELSSNVSLAFWTTLNYASLLSRNTNKMQLVIEFIIPKFIEGSTCFELDTAHHQEL